MRSSHFRLLEFKNGAKVHLSDFQLLRFACSYKHPLIIVFVHLVFATLFHPIAMSEIKVYELYFLDSQLSIVIPDQSRSEIRYDH